MKSIFRKGMSLVLCLTMILSLASVIFTFTATAAGEGDWTVVTPDNGVWQDEPTTEDTLSYKYRIYSDAAYIYVDAVVNCAPVNGGNGNGTNLRFWIKDGENSSVYTRFYDVYQTDGVASVVAKYNTSGIENKAAEITDTTAVGSCELGTDTTSLSLKVAISEVCADGDFEYFVAVSNKINENVCLFYPAITIDEAARKANFPYGKWESAAAATYTADRIYVDDPSGTGTAQSATEAENYDFWYDFEDDGTELTLQVLVEGRDFLDTTMLRVWLDNDMSDTARTTLYDFKLADGALALAERADRSETLTAAVKEYTLDDIVDGYIITVVFTADELGITGEYGMCFTMSDTGYNTMHSIEYIPTNDYAPWTTTAYYNVYRADNKIAYTLPESGDVTVPTGYGDYSVLFDGDICSDITGYEGHELKMFAFRNGATENESAYSMHLSYDKLTALDTVEISMLRFANGNVGTPKAIEIVVAGTAYEVDVATEEDGKVVTFVCNLPEIVHVTGFDINVVMNSGIVKYNLYTEIAASVSAAGLNGGTVPEYAGLTNVALDKTVYGPTAKSEYVGDVNDGFIPVSDYDKSGWAGYNFSNGAGNYNGAVATEIIDLGRVYNNLSLFRAYIEVNSGAGIGAPEKVEVLVSNDRENWVSLGNLSAATDARMQWITLQLTETASARYVKFAFTNSGEKSFIFCGELEVYSADEVAVIDVMRVNAYDWTSTEFPGLASTALSAGEILMAVSNDATATVADKIGGEWFTWWTKIMVEWNDTEGTFVVIDKDTPGSTAYTSWTLGPNRFVITCNGSYADAAGNGDYAAALANLAVGDKLFFYGDYSSICYTRGEADILLTVGLPIEDGYYTPVTMKFDEADTSLNVTNGFAASAHNLWTSVEGGTTITDLQWWYEIVLKWNADIGQFVVKAVYADHNSKSFTLEEDELAIAIHISNAKEKDLAQFSVGNVVYIWDVGTANYSELIGTNANGGFYTTDAGKTGTTQLVYDKPIQSYKLGFTVEYDSEEVSWLESESVGIIEAGLDDGNWGLEAGNSWANANGVYVFQNLLCTDSSKHPSVSFVYNFGEETAFNTVKLGLYAYYNVMIGYPDAAVKVYYSDHGTSWTEIEGITFDNTITSADVPGTKTVEIPLGQDVKAKYVKIVLTFPDSPFEEKPVWEFFGLTEIEFSKSIQPEELAELPEAAIVLDYAGYSHSFFNYIMVADADMTLGELVDKYYTGGVKDLNYFKVIVANPDGTITDIYTVLGRPDGVKTDFTVKKGQIVLALSANKENGGWEQVDDMIVGGIVTVYNVDIDAVALQNECDGIELTSAGFTYDRYHVGLNVVPDENSSAHRGIAATEAGLTDGNFAEGATAFSDAGVYLFMNKIPTSAGEYPEIAMVYRFAEATEINTVKLGFYVEYNSMVGFPDSAVGISYSDDGKTWTDISGITFDNTLASSDKGTRIVTLSLPESVTATYFKVVFKYHDSPFQDKVVWEFFGMTEFALGMDYGPVQPEDLTALPDNAIVIDYAGYKHAGVVSIVAGDGQSVAEITERGYGKPKDMNYAYNILVSADNIVLATDFELGVACSFVVPEGGYIISYNGNKAGYDAMTGISVGDVITLYNIILDPIALMDGSIALTSAGFTYETPNAYKLGDVNMNGKIDATDYLMIKRAFLGTYDLSDEQMVLADVNGNGEIDATDYLMVKRAFLGTYVIPGWDEE